MYPRGISGGDELILMKNVIAKGGVLTVTTKGPL